MFTQYYPLFLLNDVVISWKIVDRIYFMKIYIELLFLFFMNSKCKLLVEAKININKYFGY